MEGLRDVVRHPHEFDVRGERIKVQRYETLCILGRVAQAEWEHHRNAPGENLRGELFSSGKLRLGIGEREENATQVLLGWSGT
jgi:hypothetical protein